MRAAHRSVPTFSLYGEQAGVAATDSLHIEDIQSRSRKYLWKIATHRHTTLSQCIVVASGPVNALLEETNSDFMGPTVVIVPAGTVHSFRFRPETHGYVLTMDLDQLLSTTAAVHQLPIQTLFSGPRAFDLRADAALARRAVNLLELLRNEFQQPDSVRLPVCTWLAASVLAMLAHSINAETSEFASGPDLKLLRRFRGLIELNYLKHWPVQRYARQLQLSETSLNRLCKTVCGTTAFYLIQQRLALEARRRLMFVANPVHGVSFELGFKDPAYFSRFFRRHCSMSPNEFRRRHAGG
jgi:AraC family transcriptional regulator, transcriptional activator of pobA